MIPASPPKEGADQGPGGGVVPASSASAAESAAAWYAGSPSADWPSVGDDDTPDLIGRGRTRVQGE